MPEKILKISGFDGLFVCYDPNKDPMFQAILTENLRKIESVAVGKKLFNHIAQARPKSRGTFPMGCNVMVHKVAVEFTQSGYKKSYAPGTMTMNGLVPSLNPGHSPKGCPFYMTGGSFNASVDPVASENGAGSVCNMHFTNLQIRTTKGESVVPYVVLAHELIHSYHCLYGIKKGDQEELWTTGIGQYKDEPISENAFRKEFGMKPRVDYY